MFVLHGWIHCNSLLLSVDICLRVTVLWHLWYTWSDLANLLWVALLTLDPLLLSRRWMSNNKWRNYFCLILGWIRSTFSGPKSSFLVPQIPENYKIDIVNISIYVWYNSTQICASCILAVCDLEIAPHIFKVDRQFWASLEHSKHIWLSFQTVHGTVLRLLNEKLLWKIQMADWFLKSSRLLNEKNTCRTTTVLWQINDLLREHGLK